MEKSLLTNIEFPHLTHLRIEMAAIASDLFGLFFFTNDRRMRFHAFDNHLLERKRESNFVIVMKNFYFEKNLQ